MARQYLNLEFFQDAIKELAAFYKKDLSKAVMTAWYSHLRDLTEDQMDTAISTAYIKCEFMPTAEKLKEFAGFDADRLPGEMWLQDAQAAGVLPSSRMREFEEERYLTVEEKERRYKEYQERVQQMLIDMGKIGAIPSSKAVNPVTKEEYTKEDYQATAKAILAQWRAEERKVAQPPQNADAPIGEDGDIEF